MNIDEREQLTRFLEQLAQAQAGQKDGEADALIHATCARQADAFYLLVQRAMLLETAVHNSQSEIARLRVELEQARSPSRVSDGGKAFIDANAWGNSPTAQPTPALPMPPTTSLSPVPASAPATNAVPAASAWSGALGTIATTAAGVVAGGFLFQGIGHLLGSSTAPTGSTHGPSQPAPTAPDRAAADSPAPDSAADLFDTSSVDDYIASDDNA